VTTERTAVLSPDGVYRFELRRHVADVEGATVCWVMLNPSTADATVDDPTIRRCIRFTRDWGYSDLIVVNVWPYRATSPEALKRWLRSMPPVPGAVFGNESYIERAAAEADLVIAAWGSHADEARAEAVLETLQRAQVDGEVHVLGFTQYGAPRHPLYMTVTTQPEMWVRS